jgi:DNA phosphorothioation-dependent restriction protein DptG
LQDIWPKYRDEKQKSDLICRIYGQNIVMKNKNWQNSAHRNDTGASQPFYFPLTLQRIAKKKTLLLQLLGQLRSRRVQAYMLAVSTPTVRCCCRPVFDQKLDFSP